MADEEISALKQTLCTQLLLMKRLYNELEEERQASKSGSEEALSMILRLQKEKAEEKMEACQFKIMAEAKLHHAEDSLATLEQGMFQKDIEIASLKHQVKTSKQILRRYGVSNADISKLYESLRSSSSAFLERKQSHIQITREISMPSIRLSKLCSERNVDDREVSLIPTLQSIWRGIDDYHNELISDKSVIETDESNSSVDQIPEVNSNAKEFLKVQIVEQNDESKTIPANNQLQIEDESIGNTLGDDEISSNSSKALNLPSSRKVNSIKSNLLQSDIEQLKCQMQQLSDDVRILKQEDLEKGQEQIKLLTKIHEQLNTIQSHIKNSKSKKLSPKDEALFVCLTEAMLSISM